MNPNLPVHKIMSSELVTVSEDSPLKRVKEIFEQNQFHHIPVIGANGNLIGIISRKDYYRVSYLLSSSSLSASTVSMESLTASDIMTQYPIQLEPNDSIGLAADIFLSNRFHALPIVEDGKLSGIVTTHDLLKYSFNSPVEYDLDTEGYSEE
jgi:CBS domain-containing protein